MMYKSLSTEISPIESDCCQAETAGRASHDAPPDAQSSIRTRRVPMSDDLIIIDNPEGIEAYRKLSMWHMLKLEVQTGLRHSRGSVMNAIKREYPQITAR